MLQTLLVFSVVVFHKKKYTLGRAVVSGGAGGALASPEVGSYVNPIPTRGGRLYLPHYW